MFLYVDGGGFVFLSGIGSGIFICNINGCGYRSMGNNKKIIEKTAEDLSQFAINRAKFQSLEAHWGTVRIGYLKTLEGEAQNEIERIYRAELDPKWLPNRYCKGCYFKAIQDLINHFYL